MTQAKVKYNLTDLFPNCMLPNCPDIRLDGQEHQHILPKQQDILDSTAKYLYCQGGVGSAKSIAFAAKVVHLSLSIPDNKGVVSRLHYDDLFDSSWRDIKACIKRLVERDLISNPEYTKKTQGDHTEITFYNGSQIKAVQGKNWSRGLGASHGWFWVDDAMESLEEFFVGNETSAGLLSRLRLQEAMWDRLTYHSTKRPHGSLHGMISSNPPPVGHWLHKLFGNKPGTHNLGEDSVDWIMISTNENPFAGANYAKGLISIQEKMHRSTNTARRVIYGESIPAYGGVKVFPEFDHARHIAPLKYNKILPIVCGWDFGFHHPSITYSNLYKCKDGNNHYFTLSELADHFSVNVWDFYAYHKGHVDTLYKDCCLILHGGDRAGWRKSSSNRDNRGDMRILKDEYKLPFKWRFLDLDKSLQYMRKLLKTTCTCGLEIILISDKCPVLIGALEGGYKYSKTRDGKISEKPVEDRYFADVACGWRYGAENFVKWGVTLEEQSFVKQANSGFIGGRNHTPWQWMDGQQMGRLLTR